MASAPPGIKEPVTTATASPGASEAPAPSAGLWATASSSRQGAGPDTAKPSMAEVAQCGIG